MTAGSGGVRTWRLDCRYCGKGYTMTNWMSLAGRGEVYQGFDGKYISDKHERACERKARAGTPGGDE